LAVSGWDLFITKIWLYFLNGYEILIKEWQEVGKISSFENINLILQMVFLCLQVLYLQLGVAWYRRSP
jgi:hypothetical protein